MKAITFLLLFISLKSVGQQVPGKYKDNFGNELTLWEGGKYRKEWCYDLTMIWEAGNWEMIGDSLYLIPRHYMDTVNCKGKDSLILSVDTVSKRISCKEITSLRGYSVSQRDTLIPCILVRREDRLYDIKWNGKLLKKATGKEKRVYLIQPTITKEGVVLFTYKKKYPAYYYRVND